MKGELSVEMRVPKMEVVGEPPGQLKPPKSGEHILWIRHKTSRV